MSKTWTVTLDEDPETGECILPFPTDLLAELGWFEDDALSFTEEDGIIIIRKVE